MRCEVPVWERENLTVDEAAAVFSIGIGKIKDLSNDSNCPFVLWVGNKRLIKKRKFCEFLDNQYSI